MNTFAKILATKPRTLFVIHRFDVKSLEDSAGVLEVMNPMLASGLLGEHHLITLGRDTQDYDFLLKTQIHQISSSVANSPIVIYGAGAHTRQILHLLDQLNLVAIADRDASLWGTQRFSLPIIPPDQIPTFAKHVLVSSRAYEQSIVKDLTQRMGSSIAVHPLYGDNPDGKMRNHWGKLLLSTVTKFQPDLLIHTPIHPHENLKAEQFLQAKKLCPSMKIITVWWDYDEQALEGSYLDYELECLRFADLIIETSNGTRLKRMQQKQPPYQNHFDTHKVIFHPTVFDPAIFYHDPVHEKKYDIAIFGSSVGRRKYWIEALKSRYTERFHHIGGVYEDERAPIPIAEYALALRQTRIVVNTQTYPFRNQCKGKVREALACGSLLLEEENPETRLLLDDGEGIFYFKNSEELFALIDNLLENQSLRECALNAGERWRHHYTAHYWTAHILNLLFKDNEFHESN